MLYHPLLASALHLSTRHIQSEIQAAWGGDFFPLCLQSLETLGFDVLGDLVEIETTLN